MLSLLQSYVGGTSIPDVDLECRTKLGWTFDFRQLVRRKCKAILLVFSLQVQKIWWMIWFSRKKLLSRSSSRSVMAIDWTNGPGCSWLKVTRGGVSCKSSEFTYLIANEACLVSKADLHKVKYIIAQLASGCELGGTLINCLQYLWWKQRKSTNRLYGIARGK